MGDMALRFATRLGGLSGRRFSSSALSLESLKGKSLGITRFSFRQFFEEKYFWEKANLGPFFLLLFFTPTIYRSFKDFYWTTQLKKLNTEEIISDRYEWLRLNMLQDEVEAALLKQAGSVKAVQLGP